MKHIFLGIFIVSMMFLFAFGLVFGIKAGVNAGYGDAILLLELVFAIIGFGALMGIMIKYG